MAYMCWVIPFDADRQAAVNKKKHHIITYDALHQFRVRTVFSSRHTSYEMDDVILQNLAVFQNQLQNQTPIIK